MNPNPQDYQSEIVIFFESGPETFSEVYSVDAEDFKDELKEGDLVLSFRRLYLGAEQVVLIPRDQIKRAYVRDVNLILFASTV